LPAVVEIKEDSRDLTPDRILFLDCLRAIAIIMVVGFHTTGYCIPLPHNQKEVVLFIMHTVSVPVFFLVDGYLFARSAILFGPGSYSRILRRSLLRLLVPWTIFTVLYTIARYCFEITGFLKERLIVGHPLQEVTISAYASVIAPQMYFLASLFLIRLCNPVFRRIAFVKNYSLLLLTFFCYCAVYSSCITTISPYLKVEGGQEPILHALWGIQYYLLGIVLFKTSSILKLQKLFVPFLLLFLIAIPIRTGLGQHGFVLIQWLYLTTLFLFFVVLGNGLPFFNTIGKNTMGIYLIHTPVILKCVSLVLNQFVFVPIWSFISVFFGTLFLTICIVFVVNYVPYGALLFGRSISRKQSTA
jgi:surface polysaccharide O-acyltransferase-like enzyme